VHKETAHPPTDLTATPCHPSTPAPDALSKPFAVREVEITVVSMFNETTSLFNEVVSLFSTALSMFNEVSSTVIEVVSLNIEPAW
jgi:hypothetical protein